MGTFIGITFVLWIFALIILINAIDGKWFDSDVAKVMLVCFFWPIGIPIAIIYGFVRLFKIAFKKES
jgi:hypothetical protein